MPYRLELQAFSTRISVDVSGVNPAQAEELREAWSWCLLPNSIIGVEAPGDRIEPSTGDGLPRATVRSPSGQRYEVPGIESDMRESFRYMQHRLVSAVTLVSLAECQNELLMFHAAGVADPGSGRTIALIGPSGAGKSTAAAALGKTLSYVSDETVALSPDTMTVHPYAKPVSLVTSHSVVKDHVGPAALQLMPVPLGAELGLHRLVVLHRKSPGTQRAAHLVHMAPVDAVTALLPQTSYFSKRPYPIRNLLDILAKTGGALEITYSESEQLVGSTGEMFKDAEVQDYRCVGAETSSASSTGIRRAEVLEAVIVDGQLLVLYRNQGLGQDQLLVFPGIAPGLWEAATGVSFQDLVSAVVETYGPPDGSAEHSRAAAEAAVEQALREMISAGVILEERS